MLAFGLMIPLGIFLDRFRYKRQMRRWEERASGARAVGPVSEGGRRAAAPRGTRDVLPAEARVRERVIDAARDAFARYGYGAIVTPTFEETEVFVRGVGTSTDVVRKEMYTFEDRGGRSLTLRPEGTAPVVRAFVQHGMHKLPLPVKLWYLAPMFRYEAPQAGRYREHWQFGAEAIGSDDPLLDAEVIALLDGILRRLEVPGAAAADGEHGRRREPRPVPRAAGRSTWRDHLDALDEDARARMRDNPLRLFDTKDPRVAEVMRGAPTLLDHLSPAARRAPRRGSSRRSTASGSPTRRTRRSCAASTTTR